ncbi:MAG: 4-alpha-glucanotransferase [Micromonosporaceae bacterium]
MTDQQLRRLAETHGVAVRYLDWRDEPVTVSPDTLRAVLGALGVDASTPSAVAERLREAEQLAAVPRLPALSVVRQGAALPVPPDTRVVLETPDGSQPIGPDGRLPYGLPVGWYRLRSGGAGRSGASTRLAYVPDRMALPEGLAGRRLGGLMVQLYSTRSSGSWKFGDLADLAELARWSGRLGAGFTLVNPLSAGGPVTPLRPSPYLPASRRFANPLYLRVERIDGYAALCGADKERLAALARGLADADGLIDRDAVWTAKREALEQLHRMPLPEPRRAAYRAFLAREGQALSDFATWCALVEAYGPVWREWPYQLRDPRSGRVAAEAERLGVRVDFHRWLQWQLDEQLAAAQTTARDAGMPLGLLHDLAVGADPDGADAWMYQHVLASGATVGAPPDAFNRLGQDWQQPPWHPGRLAGAGYLPYRDLVRFWLRHGGGLRADHVMGLFRLWWVPDGADPSQGTYVKYDHEALVGILALEAQLAGAVVVGEDLGVVEPWVREHLAERGILGTSVLWFEESRAGERSQGGEPRPAEAWRELCLATVDTHDMPPVAGYVSGEFLSVRERLGILGQPESQARAELAGKLARWRRALVALGLMDEHETDPTAALHGFLTRTPAVLVGLSLTDLVGERRSQNLPGTDQEYPNWRIPLGDGTGREVLIDELLTRDDLAAALCAVTLALGQVRAGR